MLKLIIDTNIWISFLIGKNLKGLHHFLQDNRFQIITSNEQISELIDVLSQPKLQKYFSKVQVIDFLKLIELKSKIVDHKAKIDICRDPKDNYLLGMAISSNADYLISGDSDLLDIIEIEDTRIIEYKDFENKFMK